MTTWASVVSAQENAVRPNRAPVFRKAGQYKHEVVEILSAHVVLCLAFAPLVVVLDYVQVDRCSLGRAENKGVLGVASR